MALLDGDDSSGLGGGSTFSSASWIGYLAERCLGGGLEALWEGSGGINSTKEQDTGTATMEEGGAVETEVREKLGGS